MVDHDFVSTSSLTEDLERLLAFPVRNLERPLMIGHVPGTAAGFRSPGGSRQLFADSALQYHPPVINLVKLCTFLVLSTRKSCAGRA